MNKKSKTDKSKLMGEKKLKLTTEKENRKRELAIGESQTTVQYNDQRENQIN